MQRAGLDQGVVLVSSITLVLDGDDVKVWHIGLNSKYAVLASYTDDGVIMLDADARTLCRGESNKVTIVSLPPLGDGWTLIADCARYTCRVVAYRLGSQR